MIEVTAPTMTDQVVFQVEEAAAVVAAKGPRANWASEPAERHQILQTISFGEKWSLVTH